MAEDAEATPDFTPEADGRSVRLRLRVSAGATRRRIRGAHGGALKLSVQAPAEGGKANREIVALLAETFGVRAAEVSIVAGETSRDKVVRLPLAPAEAKRRFEASRLLSSSRRPGTTPSTA